MLSTDKEGAEPSFRRSNQSSTFRRELTNDKMGITQGQRTMCLESIQKMAYASSLDEYNKVYSNFKSSCPKNVVDYFNESWHPTKDEWVMGFKATCGKFHQ